MKGCESSPHTLPSLGKNTHTYTLSGAYGLHAPLVLPNSKSGRQPSPCLIHQRWIKSSKKLGKALLHLQSLLFTFHLISFQVWFAIQVLNKEWIICLISYEQKRIKFTNSASKSFLNYQFLRCFKMHILHWTSSVDKKILKDLIIYCQIPNLQLICAKIM